MTVPVIRAGETLHTQVEAAYGWLDRRVWIVDGSSCSMADTPELQRTFGQPHGQGEGCGFPVAKIVAMFAWASGAVFDVAIGPYPVTSIAALYGDRWTVELRLRDIKTTLGRDVLCGKSADGVRKEIVMHFLAYNLIRALMWQAATEHGRPLHRLSFAGTMQRFDVVGPYLCLFAGTPNAAVLYRLLLSWIAHDPVRHRPNRLEPRALKRRPKPYNLMSRPRNETSPVRMNTYALSSCHS